MYQLWCLPTMGCIRNANQHQSTGWHLLYSRRIITLRSDTTTISRLSHFFFFDSTNNLYPAHPVPIITNCFVCRSTRFFEAEEANLRSIFFLQAKGASTMMDDQPSCVVCKTTENDDANYLNTRLKFLISKCGHRLYVYNNM